MDTVAPGVVVTVAGTFSTAPTLTTWTGAGAVPLVAGTAG
jgi:hypothetical protein